MEEEASSSAEAEEREAPPEIQVTMFDS